MTSPPHRGPSDAGEEPAADAAEDLRREALEESVQRDFEPSDLEATAAGTSTKSLVGRAALIIMGATIIGRLLGLARDMAVAYFFGAKEATDAFFLAYKIPYLLSLTVAGALTATFIPVFTQRLVTGRKEQAWKLSVSMTNAIFAILVGLSLVLFLLAPWVVPIFGFGFKPETADRAVFLFRILIPSVIFTGIAGLATGILNSLKRFALPAFSGSLASLVSIAFIALFYGWGISSLAVGTTLGALASMIVLFPQMARHGMRYRPRIDWHQPGMREVGLLIWPILLGSGVGKVSVFVDQTLASNLVEGSVSALNYAEKLFQMPLGLFVAGITIPIFPLLSEHVAADQPDKLKATLNFGMRLIAFVMIPVSVGLIVLRVPVIRLLFERGEFQPDDTARTASALLFFCLGLFSYAGRDTLTRVFYAYHDTRTPVKISVLTVVVNIAVSTGLMFVLGVGGLTLGTTIALTLNMVVLMQLLRRKLGPMGFGSLTRALLRITAASVVMGGVVWFADRVLSDRLAPGTVGLGIRVVLSVVIGVVVYTAVAAVFRFTELREVVDMMRSVVRRPSGGQDSPSAGRT